MINYTLQHDEQLREHLSVLTRRDRNYWSFRGNSRREHGHALFHYPAMMVPQMVKAVLDQACLVHPEIERVRDPFLGSGTILTESMLRGLCFSGGDINPLAILLSMVKAGPFFIGEIEEKIAEIISRIEADGQTNLEVDFTNMDKWFQPEVQIDLSKIRRAILRENSLWIRKFLWIGMAEAVRLSSNSRTSTYKLHVRTQEDIETRNNDPIATFKKVITQNLQHLKNQHKILAEKGLLNDGHYRKDISIVLGDTRQIRDVNLSDVVLTSPSYGDNATTVPYGQYSYLPLQWIELSDIDPTVTVDYIKSTQEIDMRSLGGSKRITKNEREALIDRSPAFKRYVIKLKDQPADRANRVTAFFRDLDACLDPVLNGLRPGGLMVWTLGNRKVGGKRVPLDSIFSELLIDHQTTLICKLNRRISSKRMAPKNNHADTMSTETILVMRKAA